MIQIKGRIQEVFFLLTFINVVRAFFNISYQSIFLKQIKCIEVAGV